MSVLKIHIVYQRRRGVASETDTYTAYQRLRIVGQPGPVVEILTAYQILRSVGEPMPVIKILTVYQRFRGVAGDTIAANYTTLRKSFAVCLLVNGFYS